MTGASEPAPNKGRYRVCVIRAGLSANRNFYPDTTLREAAPLFDGVRVFVKATLKNECFIWRPVGKSYSSSPDGRCRVGC